MPTDLCAAFRQNFAYGNAYAPELSDQWADCCETQLVKHPDINTIDDLFGAENFTRVAVPIMECQRDKVLALHSRQLQIDTVCRTDASWAAFRQAAGSDLPNFIKTSKAGQDEFIGKCKSAMNGADTKSGTSGQLTVSVAEVGNAIFDKMCWDRDPNKCKNPGGVWQKNLDRVLDFCTGAGYGNIMGDHGDSKKCCQRWVEDNIKIMDIPAQATVNDSIFQYVKTKNDAATWSLSSEKNSDSQSLHHQCGFTFGL